MKKISTFKLGEDKKINEFFEENEDYLHNSVITQGDGILTILYETEGEKADKIAAIRNAKKEMWENLYKATITKRFWDKKLKLAKANYEAEDRGHKNKRILDKFQGDINFAESSMIAQDMSIDQNTFQIDQMNQEVMRIKGE